MAASIVVMLSCSVEFVAIGVVMVVSTAVCVSCSVVVDLSIGFTGGGCIAEHFLFVNVTHHNLL